MSEIEKQLEALIDKNSLSKVLEAIVSVCGAKAEHIASNWQDNSLAECWQNVGMAVEKAKDCATDNCI